MDIAVSLLFQPRQARPSSGAQVPAATEKVARQFASALDRALSAETGAVPSSPPVDVMREVAAAGERIERLRENDRELRFHVNGDTGRVQIEIRDLAGGLIREIPPSEALDAMSGGTSHQGGEKRGGGTLMTTPRRAAAAACDKARPDDRGGGVRRDHPDFRWLSTS